MKTFRIAVHPRVGGEQPSRRNSSRNPAGSSPRGRGTGCRRRGEGDPHRFIPAWAGNSEAALRIASYWSVHPRVGGEQFGLPACLCCCCGSSPRGRGTGLVHLINDTGHRFIPAWAGNSYGHYAHYVSKPVHPRVGGEQAAIAAAARRIVGSSPRGRGTGAFGPGSWALLRFIPAWAGNRASGLAAEPGLAVHPRVGGEQNFPTLYSIFHYGSSPRGRGTVRSIVCRWLMRRFIPAWAGNSNKL